MKFHNAALDPEGTGCSLTKTNRLQIFVRQVNNAATTKAHHVVMRLQICFESCRTVVKTDFGQQTVLNKGPDVLIYSGQRNGRNPVPNQFVNGFRAGMPFHAAQNVPDHLPLMCDCKAFRGAKRTEGGALHNSYYWIIILQRQS